MKFLRITLLVLGIFLIVLSVFITTNKLHQDKIYKENFKNFNHCESFENDYKFQEITGLKKPFKNKLEEEIYLKTFIKECLE